jgi:hypothetical protein
VLLIIAKRKNFLQANVFYGFISPAHACFTLNSALIIAARSRGQREKFF